jgi:hypothetical protein
MIRHRHPIRHAISKAAKRTGEVCGGYLVIAIVAVISVLIPKPKVR